MALSSRKLFALALLAGAAACAPKAPPPPDEGAIRTAIEAANAKAAAGMMAGDTAAGLANYADDAVVMMPNEKPMNGRAAISAGFGGLMSQMTLSDVKFTTGSLIVTGDYAIETGAYTMTLTSKAPKSKPMPDEGKYLTVWKKQADGAWKIIRDINNTSVPMKM